MEDSPNVNNMPSEGCNLINCYNRGCGQKYDPKENKEDSCTFHPGAPFFHDAYKGWSCCKKKCTDFTEFLNIKGCTKSFHNNVKPPEPERQAGDKSKASEVIEYRSPLASIVQEIKRPSFDTPLVEVKVEVHPTLVEQVTTLKKASTRNSVESSGNFEIPVGTACKNGGCKQTYDGPSTSSGPCTHHPGCPIFHEGLKFWSCCQRRTTDFNSFLEQEGCNVGQHVWLKEKDGNKSMNCRYDWHQTSSYVYVSVFAKKYDPDRSSVHLNPIRLKIHLFFPEEDSSFDLDLELHGVIDIDKSTANMMPTKLEVALRKGEPGSWSKLNFPNPIGGEECVPSSDTGIEQLVPDVDAVDLSDL